jgi:hypothetical protein
MPPTCRSCLHRRTTSAGLARRGFPSDGDGSGPGLLRPGREAGDSGASVPRMSNAKMASHRSKPKHCHRRRQRGRRSSSGRASSEGRRRRGYRPRTGTTKTIRHRRLRLPSAPLPSLMLRHSVKSSLRDSAASAWWTASDRSRACGGCFDETCPNLSSRISSLGGFVRSMDDESCQSLWMKKDLGLTAIDERSRATDGGEGRNIPLVQRRLF